MTQEQWLSSPDPLTKLDYLRNSGRASDRKFRLLAVSFCRHIWPLLLDARSRNAVEITERYADRLAQPEELPPARKGAESAEFETDAKWARAARLAVPKVGVPAGAAAMLVAEAVVKASAQASPVAAGTSAEEMAEEIVRKFGQQMQQVEALVRDVFGNPFRAAPAAKLSWRTPAIVALATTIYDQRSFDRLPELADALEAAGCTDADLLGHFRSAGFHVRGCWAMDLILGRQ